MNIFKRKVTMSETDSVALMVVGWLCLLLALVLHHSSRVWWLVALGVGNLFNGLRFRRKIVAAKKSQDHSDSQGSKPGGYPGTSR
jgi:hypothetical protein